MEVNESTFADLLAIIGAKWKFTPEEYPKLAGASVGDQLAFAIGHVLRHQHKSLGVFESILEHVDHGKTQDSDAQTLRVAAQKMLINQMRLCSLLGLTSDDLRHAILTWAGKSDPIACPECGNPMRLIGPNVRKCPECHHVLLPPTIPG